jgi:hypothetical protein
MHFTFTHARGRLYLLASLTGLVVHFKFQLIGSRSDAHSLGHRLLKFGASSLRLRPGVLLALRRIEASENKREYSYSIQPV